MVPWLNRQQRGAGDEYRTHPERYRQELLAVDEAASGSGGTVIAVAARPEAEEVSNIEKDRRKLHQGARDGFSAVYEAFGLRVPEPTPLLHLD